MKDEALEELREIRRLASARFDHDLDRYIAHLREGEREHSDQIRAYEEIERERRGGGWRVAEDSPEQAS